MTQRRIYGLCSRGFANVKSLTKQHVYLFCQEFYVAESCRPKGQQTRSTKAIYNLQMTSYFEALETRKREFKPAAVKVGRKGQICRQGVQVVRHCQAWRN